MKKILSMFLISAVFLSSSVVCAKVASKVGAPKEDVQALVQKRDQLGALAQKHSNDLGQLIVNHKNTMSDKCMAELSAANRQAEKVTDKECLSSWLVSIKEGQAFSLQIKPLSEQVQKYVDELEKVNIELIEALLAEKK